MTACELGKNDAYCAYNPIIKSWYQSHDHHDVSSIEVTFNHLSIPGKACHPYSVYMKKVKPQRPAEKSLESQPFPHRRRRRDGLQSDRTSGF